MSFPRLPISPAVYDSCPGTQQQPLQLVGKPALCSYRKLVQCCLPQNASCLMKVVLSRVRYWIILVFPFNPPLYFYQFGRKYCTFYSTTCYNYLTLVSSCFTDLYINNVYNIIKHNTQLYIILR